MSYFDLTAVPGTIGTELSKRASSAGLAWTAKRFPWVHLQSFSTGCDEAPLSSLGNVSLYDGFIPKPVISSVKVTKLGELGTTRKAIIGITAFTDDQLAKIQKCYLIPGMTVRIQFGWSISATGIAAPAIYTGNNKSHPKDLCEMANLAKGNTSYEGLQGLVSSFTFTLDSNNQWNITLEVVAASEGMMGTKIDSSCCDCTRTVAPKSDSGEATKNFSQLGAFFYDMADSLGSAKSVYSRAFVDGGVTKNIKYNGPTRLADGSAPTLMSTNVLTAAAAAANAVASALGSIGVTAGALSDTEECYISFSALEGALNAYSFPQDAEDGPTVKLKSTEVQLRYHPALNRIPLPYKSADPRVCSLQDAIQPDSVNLSKILVNTIFLTMCFKQVEEGDKSLQSFITTVLDGINAACGSLWEFDIVSDARCGDDTGDITTIMIIDASVVDKTPNAFNVPATPGNSAVRSIELDLKMTDAMKTQVLYGNKSDTTSRSCTDGVDCGGISLGVFGLDGTVTDTARKPLTKPPPCDCEQADPPSKAPPKTLAEVFEDLETEVTEDSVSSAITSLKGEYGKATPAEQKTTCKGATLPLSFGFTTDGIGGFRFGQVVTTDRLPPGAKQNALYQITSVEHELTPQDWTTTVKTQARYKNG